jgi:hypothetical protein
MERNAPVPDINVELKLGQYKHLYMVTDLALCLMYDFPKEGRGEAYTTALMACLAFLEGSGDDTVADVRAAFVDAAHEVEMFVLPDDGPDF